LLSVAEQIERDEDGRLGAFGVEDRFRVGQVDPALDVLETQRTPVLVDGDDFTVDEERASRAAAQLLERLCDGRELRVLFVTVAGVEGDAHVLLRVDLDGRQRADAVVLGFVDEAVTGDRRLAERGEHRPDVRHRFAPADHHGCAGPDGAACGARYSFRARVVSPRSLTRTSTSWTLPSRAGRS